MILKGYGATYQRSLAPANSGRPLTNIDPGAIDEELRAFLAKYGVPECTAIQRFRGDGSRPAPIVSFGGATAETLEKVVLRVNGMYWKERSLVVQKLLHAAVANQAPPGA